MKALITALVIALTTSLGLAQTFSQGLAAFEQKLPSERYGTPSLHGNISSTIASASTEEEVLQLKVLIDADYASGELSNVVYSAFVVRMAAKATAISSNLTYMQEALTLLEDLNLSNSLLSYRKGDLLFFAFRFGLPVTEDTSIFDLASIHSGHPVWRTLLHENLETYSPYWLEAVTQAPDIRGAKALIRQITSAYSQGFVEEEKLRAAYNSLYLNAWTNYLMSEDKTTPEAANLAALATFWKSMRDSI